MKIKCNTKIFKSEDFLMKDGEIRKEQNFKIIDRWHNQLGRK